MAKHDWFHTVADRLAEPVVLLSPSGGVRALNPPAQRALSPTPLNLAELAEGEEAFRRYLALASRSGTPLPGAVQLAPTGARWRCDAAAVQASSERLVVLQLRSATETARRFLVLNQQIERLHAEIRRRELLEEEREQLLARERGARAAAEEASRVKDELLASVSHELRTPLHAISGWLNLIREDPGDHALLQRGLEVIERNVAAQTQLTEDLVDASLVVTGRMKLHVQPVELELVIREAAEGAAPGALARRQRIQVVAHVGDCVVNGDPDRLLQIVRNLLANASKYTPEGGTIQVVLRRVNSHAEIIVSDTGEGIAPEVLPYVFDRFRRADGSTTRRSGGLGLGLSIVRHLVELHGGMVFAESEGLGKGSCFTVNLPLPVFRRQPATDPGASGPLHDPGKPLGGLRVLLVEDHADSRELLQNILQARGASVRAVVDSPSAQVAFAEEPVECVVSDIEMPGEDGFTLMRKLRELEREQGRPPALAIAVSAHSIGDARLHALRAGFQAFLTKPMKSAELIATVTSLMQGRATAS